MRVRQGENDAAAATPLEGTPYQPPQLQPQRDARTFLGKRLVSPVWSLAGGSDTRHSGQRLDKHALPLKRRKARALSQQLGLRSGFAPPPLPQQGEVLPGWLAWWALSLHIPSCMRGLPAHQVVARGASRRTGQEPGAAPHQSLDASFRALAQIPWRGQKQLTFMVGQISLVKWNKIKRPLFLGKQGTDRSVSSKTTRFPHCSW
ncbi:hypothetical protein GQ607_000628 [Colletotrichum asianum]|uniref:Uncharacterized protein n=1 Tax=Colletotrichum asianum TaxID=702518 RepID=A0A8H3WVZ4_9PEZI|nr:hypothetical protein GQ607_000628 [Colletotrichum asianum]